MAGVCAYCDGLDLKSRIDFFLLFKTDLPKPEVDEPMPDFAPAPPWPLGPWLNPRIRLRGSDLSIKLST